MSKDYDKGVADTVSAILLKLPKADFTPVNEYYKLAVEMCREVVMATRPKNYQKPAPKSNVGGNE